VPLTVCLPPRLQVALVNGRTASTTEMLASSLHMRGATLVGEPTLGKGRTQTVFNLPDGSLLLVSVLKYLGARGEQIDAGGLKPDVACVPMRVGEQRYAGGAVGEGVDLREDPCIDLAARLMQ
jgi:C-terminal processing protease CtpA/Prc